MGGSLDAFKLYLDLFKVREEPAAAEHSTFWGSVDKQNREEARAEIAKLKPAAKPAAKPESDSGYNSEEAAPNVKDKSI